jgi:pre-mRNA-splicing factor CWC26
MSIKVPRSKTQEDDDLSPPRRRVATADHVNSPRRHDTSSHRQNDRYSRQESSSLSSTHGHQPKEESSSSSTYRRSKQESSPPPFQPAKSERRCLAEHQEKIAQRYAQWGRGLAQVRQSEDAVKDYLEQAEKPLARYRDDKDLDIMLKQKEREGKLTSLNFKISHSDYQTFLLCLFVSHIYLMSFYSVLILNNYKNRYFFFQFR